MLKLVASGPGAAVRECNRLRDDVIPAYESIGASGTFGIAMMRASIRVAE